jgi:hypothetical protein
MKRKFVDIREDKNTWNNDAKRVKCGKLGFVDEEEMK